MSGSEPRRTSAVADAYADYADMHARCPVAHRDELGGYYVLATYEDVRASARDWRTFTSASGVILPRTPDRITLIEDDPPQHGMYRRLALEGLSVGALKPFEPRVAKIARDVIAEFASVGSCDLVRDYAEQVPVVTICAVLGLTDHDPIELRRIAIAVADAHSDPELFVRELAVLSDLLLEEVAMRRERPRDDYLTRVATFEADGRRLDDREIVGLLALGFLVAGHESTTSALSSLLFHALSVPGRARQMLADPDLLSAAIEETVRLNTPFHAFHRTTTKAVTMRDVEIAENCDVMLNWAAANRDPEVFDDPTSFRLDRSRNFHVGFGYGIHACVGAALARMEMRIAFGELLGALPDLRLETTELHHEFSGGYLAFVPSLPASFTPVTVSPPSPDARAPRGHRGPGASDHIVPTAHQPRPTDSDPRSR